MSIFLRGNNFAPPYTSLVLAHNLLRHWLRGDYYQNKPMPKSEAALFKPSPADWQSLILSSFLGVSLSLYRDPTLSVQYRIIGNPIQDSLTFSEKII